MLQTGQGDPYRMISGRCSCREEMVSVRTERDDYGNLNRVCCECGAIIKRERASGGPATPIDT
jgi:hypothetical protein